MSGGSFARATLSILLTTFAVSQALGIDRPTEVQDLLKAKPEAVEAWKDMRFGMFICWGPVSLTGKEIGWSRGSPTPIEEYDALYKKWSPDKFDAREWMAVVKETGARYVVFLLKHHDGFCLWDTKQTDYNIMNGPFKRDVLKEVATACREQGIGLFPYYSTCDWHHPDFPMTGWTKTRPVSNLDRYTQYLEAQIKELITGYGPFVGIWFDVPQGFDRARGERVIRFVRALQPDIIVNNRTGAPGDFDTPEQHIGGFQNIRPWESCMTLGTQWSWKPDDKLKPFSEAIRILVRCAAGDGNLALNASPMPDGRMEPRQVESFLKIGQWMKQYGHSLYGTRGGPVKPAKWGGTTRKDKTLYVHVLHWWPDGVLTLPALSRKVLSHSVLTGGEASLEQTDRAITITVAAEHRHAVDTIIELNLDASAMDIPTTSVKVMRHGKSATASGEWSGDYSADKAFDDDETTRWGGAAPSRTGWLAVDLGSPKTITGAAIWEYETRVQKFRLQFKENETWTTLVEGTTLGTFQTTFKPITAQHVRLEILEAANAPSIYEFHLTTSTTATKGVEAD
jgi:alpha-L-fucosidase